MVAPILRTGRHLDTNGSSKFVSEATIMSATITRKILVCISFSLLSQSLFSAELAKQDPVIEKLLSNNAEVRQDGKSMLLSIAQKDPSAVEKYLDYEDWRVRYDTVSTLGRVPGRESTRYLLRTIFQDTNGSVVSIASHGLKGQEKHITKDELQRLLEMDNRVVIRAALGIVENIPIDESTVVPLARRLEDKRWYIRTDTARSLGKAKGLKTETTVGLILNAMKGECRSPTPEPNTPDAERYIPLTAHVKSLYRAAILQIGTPTIPFLRERVKREKGEFRKQLIITLGYLGEPTVYGEVVEIAASDANNWSRAWAIGSLGKIGNKQAIPLLKKALEDPFVVRGGDVTAPEGYEEWNLRYPIRDAAFSSLVELGVRVETKGSGKYRVLPKVREQLPGASGQGNQKSAINDREPNVPEAKKVDNSEEPRFSRPEEKGEDLSLLASPEVVGRLAGSKDKIELRKAAKVLGDRSIAGKLTLSSEEKGEIAKTVDGYLRQAKSKDANERVEASQQIERLWWTAAPTLLRNINSREPAVAELAIKSLILMRNEDIIQRTIEIAKTTDDDYTKSMAIFALKKMKEQRKSLIPGRRCLNEEESEALYDQLIVPSLKDLEQRPEP